ncbi:MAG: hypothetical protein RMK89_04215 [Armatimonadota bacterium]|nr:hypothetical protein [Armatimonadota bacterium]MDW8142651.1 hypothetical protein [Armatimonadota bacterium]
MRVVKTVVNAVRRFFRRVARHHRPKLRRDDDEPPFLKGLFKGAKKLIGGAFKGVTKAAKGFLKNPLKAIIKSPLKVGLPVLGGALLASQLFRRKKLKPEVPEHIRAIQERAQPLAEALLSYGMGISGITPTETQFAQQQARLAQQLGGSIPLLGSFLGGALAAGGMRGLRELTSFLGGESVFERPEYSELFSGLRAQAARAMEETVSPILSRMQAMGLGQSSAAVGELARAQERIMEDLQRQISSIAAQAFEAERGRELAAAERLYGGLPTAFDLAQAGGMGGLQALQVGLQAAATPRNILMQILGGTPIAEAFLTAGAYPLYAPSVGEQLLGAGGQLAAIYDIFRRRR